MLLCMPNFWTPPKRRMRRVEGCRATSGLCSSGDHRTAERERVPAKLTKQVIRRLQKLRACPASASRVGKRSDERGRALQSCHTAPRSGSAEQALRAAWAAPAHSPCRPRQVVGGRNKCPCRRHDELLAAMISLQQVSMQSATEMLDIAQQAPHRAQFVELGVGIGSFCAPGATERHRPAPVQVAGALGEGLGR